MGSGRTVSVFVSTVYCRGRLWRGRRYAHKILNIMANRSNICSRQLNLTEAEMLINVKPVYIKHRSHVVNMQWEVLSVWLAPTSP